MEIYKRFIQNAKLRLTVASLGTQVTLDYISPIDYAKELCDDVKRFCLLARDIKQEAKRAQKDITEDERRRRW